MSIEFDIDKVGKLLAVAEKLRDLPNLKPILDTINEELMEIVKEEAEARAVAAEEKAEEEAAAAATAAKAKADADAKAKAAEEDDD